MTYSIYLDLYLHSRCSRLERGQTSSQPSWGIGISCLVVVVDLLCAVENQPHRCAWTCWVSLILTQAESERIDVGFRPRRRASLTSLSRRVEAGGSRSSCKTRPRIGKLENSFDAEAKHPFQHPGMELFLLEKSTIWCETPVANWSDGRPNGEPTGQFMLHGSLSDHTQYRVNW